MNRDEELEAWKELYKELLARYQDFKSRCTCHMKNLPDDTEEIEVIEESEGIEETVDIEENDGIEETVEIEENEGIEETERIEETVEIEDSEGIEETVVIEDAEGIEETMGIEETEGIEETVEIDEIDEIEEETLDTSDSQPPLMLKDDLPPDSERSETNRLISYAPPKLPVGSIYDLHCINNFLKTEQGERVIRKAYFKHVPAKHVIVDIFFEREFLTKVEFSKVHHSRQVVLRKFPNFLKFFCGLNKEFYDFSEDKTLKRLKGTIHRQRKGLRK
ncbi:uncharacterized protein LOC125958352 [Anopheles darlingi]|uniref:uncharacterized protein LOC125958352 n=1 Tax=Anopheles darlingi TaxID=43151 RepID=UPI00210055A6|nr:uncharacterized protein LOC125958352 [Anopheles darlingi]